MWADFRSVERESMTSNLASPVEPLVVLLCFVSVLLAGYLACLSIVAKVFRRWRPPGRVGLCTASGYDLYGPPQPRCPECGTSFQRDFTYAAPRD